MSKLEKLLSEVKAASKDLRYEQLETILVRYLGYTKCAPRGGSSHITFRKKDAEIITIPNNSPVKKIYVEKVAELLLKKEGGTDEKEKRS